MKLATAEQNQALQEKVTKAILNLNREQEATHKPQIPFAELPGVIETVTAEVRESLAWSGGLPFTTIIHNAIVRVLDAKKIDLDDERIEQKYQHNEEQLKRNSDLCRAQELLREKKPVRTKTLTLVKEALMAGFSPEMFNEEAMKEEGLSNQQLNDLSDNFIFWVLDNHPQMGKLHKIVVYLGLFRGFDSAAIKEHLETLKREDEAREEKPDPQMLTAGSEEKIEKLYRQFRDVIRKEGDSLIEAFAQKADFRQCKDSEVIGNYESFRERKRYYHEQNKNKTIDVEGLRGAEKFAIEFPRSSFDKCLEEINILLAQRGNISARNRGLVNVIRLIGSIVRRGRARYWVEKEGCSYDYLDMEQELALELLEKVAYVDPRKCRISTYLGRWAKALVDRYLFEHQTIRIPIHLKEVLVLMRRNPDKDDREIIEMLKAMGHTKQNIKPQTLAILRSDFMNHRMQSMDEEAEDNSYGGSGRARTIGDLIAAEVVKKEGNAERLKDPLLREAVAKVLELFPPRDRMILIARVLGEKTLEEVGQELGITRERVRQLEERILNNARPGPRQGKIKHSGKYAKPTKFVLRDEAKLRKWFEGKEKQQRGISTQTDLYRVFKRHLGISEEDSRAMTAAEIYEMLTIEKTYENTGGVLPDPLGFKMPSLREKLKRLKEALVEDMARAKKEDRFVELINDRDIYGIIAAKLGIVWKDFSRAEIR